MAKNKIIYGGEVLIDLTGDTVTPGTMLVGATAHDKSGEIINGSCTFDSDTSDDDAAVAEILLGKTAHARRVQLVGTMPNNGGVSGTISSKTDTYNVPIGYHDGSGKVGISSTEQSKIIPGNIKSGVTILGVDGTYSGDGAKLQSKTITPSTSQQSVQPDSGYDGLSLVTVNAIPYVESSNSAGGTTVTIA